MILLRLCSKTIWLVSILLAILLMIWVIESFFSTTIFTQYDKPLYGIEEKQKFPVLSIKDIRQGDFQKQFETWFTQNLPFRGVLVRFGNDILYTFFSKSYSFNSGIIIGKSQNLLGESYTKIHCAIFAPRTTQELNNWVRKLKYVQEKLNAEGRTFIYLITPSKTSYFPEYIPASYPCASAHLTRPNYRRLTKLLDQAGINYVDGSQITLSHKAKLETELFSAGGIHWNVLGATLTTVKLLEKINQVGGYTIPSLKYIVTVSHTPSILADRDYFDSLNLGMIEPSYPVPVLSFEVASKNIKRLPKVTMVGGSFLGEIFNILGKTTITEINYFQYFKLARLKKMPNQAVQLINVDINNPVTFDEIYSSPILILEENEEGIGGSNHGLLFMEKLGVL